VDVLLLHQYFHPDVSSVSQILSRIAFDLASHGHRVTALASRNVYDASAGTPSLPARETAGGVEIVRAWGPSLGRSSLWRRGADMSSYLAQAFLRPLLGARPDVTVAFTNPLLLPAAAGLLRKVRGGRLVLVLMDVYPEVAVEAGVLRRGGAAHRILARLSAFAYRAADAVVVLGGDMREVAVGGGADPGKIVEIPNWADTDGIRPVAPGENRLRREWGLEGKFVVMYSGNLGVSHAFAELLDAAEILARDDDVRFLFVGGGARFREVREEGERRGLSNLLFRPYQDASVLSESLSAGDVHYVSLREGFEGLVVPSKAYGILAAGRPILYQGTGRGEIARMVGEEGTGVVVPPGDGEALARAILRFRDDPALLRRTGEEARRSALGRHSAAEALERYRRVVEGEPLPAGRL
jgi:glycosyltransferase involved in cell wall biosynthesis